ncbi:GNAT family N-acetyltransferase [Afifella sp. IM 167]|uniref:GNAT family N-acetyltransferase n=1 Tax=Afifella sp. IM 167 TaxID=2033586 RepID=UPI001CC90BBF|nr:GNAT family N-acetyltransferase [Afifella sp. IM 167]MBZ8135043.1 GNAT family N-acetyltransferase [Afifella sp. IM 167]
MPEKFRFRTARAEDLVALNRLTQSSAAYDGAYRAILQGYEITARQLDAGLFVLAEQDGEILGYYGLKSRPEPELDLFFVADGAQGSGLGRRLFAHMCDKATAEGFRSIRIVSHPPALRFYEKMGARRVGTEAPRGRIAWERPILTLHLSGRQAASRPVRDTRGQDET